MPDVAGYPTIAICDGHVLSVLIDAHSDGLDQADTLLAVAAAMISEAARAPRAALRKRRQTPPPQSSGFSSWPPPSLPA